MDSVAVEEFDVKGNSHMVKKSGAEYQKIMENAKKAEPSK